MNVLIVGKGGREHALAWKVSKSPRAERIFLAPGNAGTMEFNVPISMTDIRAVCEFARHMDCVTIVGPEAPLELGLVDELERNGLRVFGPSKTQAKLETSKAFSKKFMAENNIPTAAFRVFYSVDEATAYIDSTDGNVVVKADGLASGKGVTVCSDREQARRAVKAMMIDKIFDRAGEVVVVEEKLTGREISLLAISDGTRAVPFGTAVDHKGLLDGDDGPNTGGMGAYSPAEEFGEEKIQEVMDLIVLPTVKKTGFRGFLYTGLILCEDGPRVLEFNARLGDPETQVILPRLDSDLLDFICSLLNGDHIESLPPLRWKDRVACGVVMCSKGYPKSPRLGDEISGLDNHRFPETLVYHSGTAFQDGKFVTDGGRVLCMTALGASVEEAAERAYLSVKSVSWEGEFHRHDIGRKTKQM